MRAILEQTRYFLHSTLYYSNVNCIQSHNLFYSVSNLVLSCKLYASKRRVLKRVSEDEAAICPPLAVLIDDDDRAASHSDPLVSPTGLKYQQITRGSPPPHLHHSHHHQTLLRRGSSQSTPGHVHHQRRRSSNQTLCDHRRGSRQSTPTTTGLVTMVTPSTTVIKETGGRTPPKLSTPNNVNYTTLPTRTPNVQQYSPTVHYTTIDHHHRYQPEPPPRPMTASDNEAIVSDNTPSPRENNNNERQDNLRSHSPNVSVNLIQHLD